MRVTPNRRACGTSGGRAPAVGVGVGYPPGGWFGTKTHGQRKLHTPTVYVAFQIDLSQLIEGRRR